MIKFEIDLSEFRKLDLDEPEKLFLLQCACFHMNEGKPYIHVKSGGKPPIDEFYIDSDMETLYFPSSNSFSSIPLVYAGNKPHFFRRKRDFFIHNEVTAALSNVVAFFQKCFVEK